MERRSRSHLILAAAGAAAALLIVLLVSSHAITSSAASTKKATPPKDCTIQVQYFVTAEHFFGPPVTQSDVAGQLIELHNRRCLDPALVTAHAWGENLPGFVGLNADQLTLKTDELAGNSKLWMATIRALEKHEKEAVSVRDTTLSGPYQTLYMVAQPTGAPLIRAASPDRPSFEVLEFTWDKSVFDMKLSCGFQNVAQTFVGIPPLNSPPNVGTTPGTSPPGGTTPHTVPSTTPTTTPGTTPTTVACPPGQEGPHGKCIPPTTVPAPPVTSPPATTPTTKPSGGDSGPGAPSTVPTPTTEAPAPPPPVTSPPVTHPVGPPKP